MVHEEVIIGTTSPPATGEPVLDVLMAGPVFFDIVFTDLPAPVVPGQEVWAAGMGSGPGGIANLAVAARRLGLRTGLAAGFGDDAYGRWCWDVLARSEGVDLSRSRMHERWHTAVTVSIAMDGDRAMVTHGHEFPVGADDLVGAPPATRSALIELPSGPLEHEPWWLRSAHAGALVFADIGWDPTGTWDRARLEPLASCHAFSPNQVEAMAYTRTDTPQAALSVLSEHVPLAVVTRGADGAVAHDATTGETASVPRVEVHAIDPTGAGDVFAAALVVGTLAQWPLADRLAFSALCSALAVQQFGGSLAAPGWGDISDWWSVVRAGGDRELVRRYGFLDDVVPTHPAARVRRADATLTVHSDLPEPPGPGTPHSVQA